MGLPSVPQRKISRARTDGFILGATQQDWLEHNMQSFHCCDGVALLCGFGNFAVEDCPYVEWFDLEESEERV